MVSVVTIPQIPTYIAPFKPLNNITPFTYRDGMTYLEVLEEIRRYVNHELIDFINTNFTKLGDDFEIEVNKLIDAVNEAIEEVTENTENYQDAVIAGIISNLESQTRVLLDDLYANQTTSNETVAGYVTNPGATKTALDAAYAGQETTDSDVAAFINNPISNTRTALDNIYANSGGSPISSFVEISEPFNPGGFGRIIAMRSYDDNWYGIGIDDSDDQAISSYILISSNGVVFESHLIHTEALNYPQDIAFNGSTYVVIIGDNAYTSSDGVTWNNSPIVGFTDGAIQYSEVANLFIGVSGTDIYTSPDGINWTNRVSAGVEFPVAGINTGDYNPFAESNSVIVIPVTAFESWPPASNPSSAFLTSTDGINWNINNPPAPIENSPYSPVIYHDGFFYGFSDQADGVKSADGITWENIVTPRIGNGVKTGNVFVGFSVDGLTIAYASKDMISWIKSVASASGATSVPPGTFYTFRASNNAILGWAFAEGTGNPGTDQSLSPALIAVES